MKPGKRVRFAPIWNVIPPAEIILIVETDPAGAPETALRIALTEVSLAVTGNVSVAGLLGRFLLPEDAEVQFTITLMPTVGSTRSLELVVVTLTLKPVMFGAPVRIRTDWTIQDLEVEILICWTSGALKNLGRRLGTETASWGGIQRGGQD